MPSERLDPLIHQQTRLQIMGALYRNHRASFTDLRDGLGLTGGNLATHTARLEEAGYLRTQRALTRQGFEVQFILTERGLLAFGEYLATLREVLQELGAAGDGFSRKQTPSTSEADAS